MVTFFIHNIPLLVHHVIIFQQAFTDAKVVFFHFLLRPFDRLGDHAVLDHFAFFITHAVHKARDTLTAEHTHQVVFQRYKETGATGIALAAGTATQLPVDPAAFMPLCTDDGQSARFFYTGAKLDIGSTTRHVGSDGNGAGQSGFGNHLRFLGVLFRVQYIMRNIFLLQHTRKQFTHFHGSGTHQGRTAHASQFFHFLDHGLVFLPLGFVYKILLVFSDHFYVGRNGYHIQFIDAPELGGFRFGGTGHTGQLMIHTEVVLQGDGGIGLRGGFDLHIFLRFDGLVQPVGITASFEDTARLFIHDLHRSFEYHVLDIFFKQGIGFQQLLNGMDAIGFQRIIIQERFFAVQFFFIGDTAFFDLRKFGGDIRQDEELRVFARAGDQLDALVGKIHLVVLLINIKEQFRIHFRHFLLLIGQVIVLALLEFHPVSGFTQEFDQGAVLR